MATYTAVGDPTSTFTWSVLGGNIIGSPTGPTCTVQWQGAGPGKITVTETSVNGCPGSLDVCIEIIESPIANITALPDTGLNHIDVCKGTEIVFIDYSYFDPSSPIVSWRWDFGDGTFSNGKGGPWAPITHTYNFPGPYLVKLTVTNQCGCSTTDSIMVEVSPDPGVEIICPGVVCENTNYNYKVSSTCPGGIWSVMGGTIITQSSTQVEVKWDNVNPLSGYGYLVYDPAGSCPGMCPNPVAKKIPVVQTNSSIQGPDYLCIGEQYLYSLPQWPTTKYFWTVSNPDVTLQATDQPNEIVLVPGSLSVGGSVTLTCNYTNTLLGCTGTATKVISIPDQVYFVDSVWEYCIGIEKRFDLGGPIANTSTGEWTLVKPDNTVLTGGPNNTFVVFMDQVGTYLLSVKGNFCPPETKEIKVLGIPDTPEFILGPNTLCRGVPEEYLAGISDPNHIFVWDISNGSLNIPVGDATEVTLDPASGYPFTLSVVRETKDKPHCRSAPLTKQIEAPIVFFLVYGEDTVCPSNDYEYFTTYSESEEYVWSVFPQTMGSVDEGQGTSKVKVLWNQQPGEAKLICRIKKCNVYSYDTFSVYIRPLILDLTLDKDTVCMYDFVQAQVNLPSAKEIVWYNGVESFKTPPGVGSKNLRYGYVRKDIKSYTITATVEDPWGCPAILSDEDSVVVVPAPWLYITPSRIVQEWDCLPIDVDVVVTYDTTGVAPTSYQWWKNGSPISTDSVLNVTDTGRYSLIVTGAYPACDNWHHVDVDPNCDNGGGTCDTCQGDPPVYCTGYVSMQITSYDICSDIVTLESTISNPSTFIGFDWRVSDDSVELISFTDSTATYKVKKAGVHRFYYAGYFYDTGEGSCSSEVDTFLEVPTVLDLIVEPLCAGAGGMRQVRLTDNSTSMVPIAYHAFQVGANYHIVYDGPNRSYVTSVPAGSMTDSFRLIVWTAEDSCSDDVFLNLPYLPSADFSFSRSITCEKDAPVQFTSLSIPPPGNLTHLWRFGDNSENTQQDPYRVYDDPGTFDAWLIVSDQWGCKDSITKKVNIIERDLEGRVVVSPEFPCEFSTGIAQYNNNQGSRTPTDYYWYNKSVIIGQTAHPVDYQNVYKSGFYFAKVEDRFGCKHTAEADTVQFIKTARANIIGDQLQCENVPFTLSGYAGPISGLTYIWERDGSIISGATGADITEKLAAGNYVYNVITRVPSPGGGFCEHRSDSFKVTVNPTPAAPNVSFTVLDCNDYTLQLDVSPAAPGTYNWSNGMQGTPINVQHGGPYQVTYTDSSGCMTRAKIQTPKDLRVYMWMFPTGCYSICPTNPNMITGPIIPFDRWDYLHNGGSFAGSNGNFYDVSLNGTGHGTYNMYLQNTWCNLTSGDMAVDTNCIPGGPGSTTMYRINTDAPGISDPQILVLGEPQLRLAPNPAANSTHVTYTYPGNTRATFVEVYDVLGRILYGRQLHDNKGGFDMNLESFAPGTYQVILRRGPEVLMHKRLSVTR